jgi:hypothetical protein
MTRSVFWARDLMQFDTLLCGADYTLRFFGGGKSTALHQKQMGDKR